MLGQVVVDDQHITAGFHEVLGNAGCCIRRDVGQAGRLVAFGDDDHGVVHRILVAQRRDHFGHRRRALADGAVDADHVLPALVQDGVECNRGLAGLAVAEDQFALAPTDRDHRVDDLESGLQWHVDWRAIHDGGGGPLDRPPVGGVDGPEPVERAAERVDDAPQQRRADRHVHHAAGAQHLVASLQVPVLAQQHHAEFMFVDVESDAGHAPRKGQLLVKTGTRQAADMGDAGGHLGDGADLAWHECRRERGTRLRQRGKATIERIRGDALHEATASGCLGAAAGLAAGTSSAATLCCRSRR